MSFAKILAPLTGSPRDSIVLASAFAAARPFNALVEALFVRPDPVESMPLYGESMSSAVVQEIMDVSKEASGKAAHAARATLEASARAAQVTLVAAPERRDGVTAVFVETQGNFADCVAQSAKLSDLVVFGSLKDDDRPGLVEAFEETMIETGRPLLLSKEAPGPDFARKIAIAWNASVVSAHAVTAALPFLKQAQSVEILTVKRHGSDLIPADDVKAYLQLREIVATEKTIDAGTRAVADVLLEAAGQSGAGMLVAGGYGRSRLREMFTTGTTRKLIAQASLPCFLVH
jgi:nucleotide-binding universal stress UspA family protein